jgi:PEP-CTERM motif
MKFSHYNPIMFLATLAAGFVCAPAAQAVSFNFTYDQGTTWDQKVGFEMAGQLWSSYLTDDVPLNFHVGMTEMSGQNLGGAMPAIKPTQDYSSFLSKLNQDKKSAHDYTAVSSLNGTSTSFKSLKKGSFQQERRMMLTRANSKALNLGTITTSYGGVDTSVSDSGVTVTSPLGTITTSYGGLDGYIQLSSTAKWNYDFLRQNSVASTEYDFLTVAMHEIGHTLGFISGLDGANKSSSLDLYRFSSNSVSKNAVDFSMGSSAYFSIDRGKTNLANFSTGEGGDSYQAGHWNSNNLVGLMNPNLKAGTRVGLSQTDLIAMDAIGWDINQQTVSNPAALDLARLKALAETEAASAWQGDRSTDVARMIADSDIYSLGYSKWWQSGAEDSPQSVPEPTSVMGLLGMALLGLKSRYKRSAQ